MILRLVVGALLFSAVLFGDGGRVVFRKEAGPFFVTLFSSPEPLRVGAADLSVLVERGSDREPVLDAQVAIEASGSSIPARHGAATNRLLYAARVEFAQAGLHRVAVRVNGDSVTGELKVLPKQAPLVAYWPYFAVVPIALILFALNQRLKARRAARL